MGEKIDDDGAGGADVTRLAIVKPTAYPVSAETLETLRSLVIEGEAGEICGMACAVLCSDGSFRLLLRGEALEERSQMGVAGMLAALQKMVLELHD